MTICCLEAHAISHPPETMQLESHSHTQLEREKAYTTRGG